MSAKRILSSSITGQRGVNLIERVVLSMGFLWYPTGGVEAGIDGMIEIRNSTSGEVTNSVVQVQSKTGPSFFKSETETSFDFACDEKDLNYWLQGNAPVVLVVSRPQAREGTRFCLNDGLCRGRYHQEHSGKRAKRDQSKGFGN
jgi:hypothetical protein